MSSFDGTMSDRIMSELADAVLLLAFKVGGEGGRREKGWHVLFSGHQIGGQQGPTLWRGGRVWAPLRLLPLLLLLQRTR